MPNRKKPADAVTLLIRQHAALRGLFQRYRELATTATAAVAERRAIVDDLCLQLSLHARIEDELFYPVVRKPGWSLAPTYVATRSHAEMFDVIEVLASMPADHRSFDATVVALEAAVLPHFKEEEVRMFPSIRDTTVDLLSLATLLEERHEVLAHRRSRADGSAVPAFRRSSRLASGYR